jgi:hypothetical protein
MSEPDKSAPEAMLAQDAERERLESVSKAVALFERLPGFAAAQVKIHDQQIEAEKECPDGKEERLSESRFQYRTTLLDIKGASFAPLVIDRDSQAAFIVIMQEFARILWYGFSGIPLEDVPPSLPFT